MGYIVGANVAEAFGQWQYALRVSLIFMPFFKFIILHPTLSFFLT
jgi:hypothetical protein